MASNKWPVGIGKRRACVSQERNLGVLIVMLEKLSTPGFETISTPDSDTCTLVKTILDNGNVSPTIAEIGIGIGTTTQAVAKILNNRGQLHVFDLENKVAEVVSDLAGMGFSNVTPYPNSTRYWDSYNWSLMKLMKANEGAIYDLIYLDGAHTFFHDALAFVLCDRLLKVGGYMISDDYYWTFAKSRYMADKRDQFMTSEQIETRQVALVVDLLVASNPQYEVVTKNKVYKKVLPTPVRATQTR